MQLKRKDQCPLSTVPRLAGDSRSVKVRTPKGCQGGAAGVAKQKKKRKQTKETRTQSPAPPSAALRHSLRPSRCGRLKPVNMVGTWFLCRGFTTLAGLLLLPFGSLAASQIEVGARRSERQGPGGTAVSWP